MSWQWSPEATAAVWKEAEPWWNISREQADAAWASGAGTWQADRWLATEGPGLPTLVGEAGGRATCRRQEWLQQEPILAQAAQAGAKKKKKRARRKRKKSGGSDTSGTDSESDGQGSERSEVDATCGSPDACAGRPGGDTGAGQTIPDGGVNGWGDYAVRSGGEAACEAAIVAPAVSPDAAAAWPLWSTGDPREVLLQDIEALVIEKFLAFEARLCKRFVKLHDELACRLEAADRASSLGGLLLVAIRRSAVYGSTRSARRSVGCC